MKTQVNRRAFLKQTRNASVGIGATLALPNIFLNETKAATGENPSDLARIGFIAVGNRGMQNMGFFLKKKMVAAICDVDKNIIAKAQTAIVKAQGKPVTAYGDYRKLLEDKSLDGVVISTPDHWHAMQAVDACQAGKDVYCEKPLTLFIEEGKTLVKIARKTNRIVQTGSMQRSMKTYRTAIEMLRLGKIGKVHTIKVGLPKVNWDPKLDNTPDSAPPPELDYNMWLGPAPDRPYNKSRVHYYFRFFWDYSGGQMTNWGAHHLDIAQWGLEMDNTGPVEIEGKAEYDPQKRFEVFTWSSIQYKYANGVKIDLNQGAKADQPATKSKSEITGTVFIGDKGIIHVNRPFVRTCDTQKMEDLDDIPAMPDDQLKHIYVSLDHYQNWLDCIKSRKLPICDVAIGHRSATVCHLGNIAARLGRKIKWDPEKEEMMNDAEAAKLTGKVYRPPWKL
ncbi:MAG: Gfo/Idh/MocA family oxidoreductase [Verrucomicrobiota bacterium]